MAPGGYPSVVRWILLDVLLVLLVTGLLALAGLSLWRRVKALGRAVVLAGEQLTVVSAQLESLQDRDRGFPVPTPAGHQSQARQPPFGVRSTPTVLGGA